MGWFDHGSDEASAFDTYNNVAPEHHEAKLSHEVIGGAAAYEAMKAYEEHKAKNGAPDDHAKAKEILAGIAGAAVDRLVESKGLDFIDREKAKHDAQKRLEHHVAREY